MTHDDPAGTEPLDNHAQSSATAPMLNPILVRYVLLFAAIVGAAFAYRYLVRRDIEARERLLVNHYKLLSLAITFHRNMYRTYPSAVRCSPVDLPENSVPEDSLSWAVTLAPYVGLANFHTPFEPCGGVWQSEQNQTAALRPFPQLLVPTRTVTKFGEFQVSHFAGLRVSFRANQIPSPTPMTTSA